MIIGILTSLSLLFGFLIVFNSFGEDEGLYLVFGIVLIIIGFFLFATFIV